MIKLQEVVGYPSLQWHIDHNRSLSENVYRYSSKSFIELFKEAREAYNKGIIELNDFDKDLIENTDIGEVVFLEGKEVPLDLPMLNEAEYRGKDVDLNKPKRGGSGNSAYHVYVRDPKTKKVKKINFGSGGLRAKVSDPEARKRFAARHNCKDKKDKTKAGYWSCRTNRYWKSLGGDKNYPGYW